MSWNAHSICNKEKMSKLEMFMRTNSVVIATIQETWLKENNNLTSEDYSIVRRDRMTGKKGGGVAILVHNSLKFRVISLPDFDTLEVVAVEIFHFNIVVLSVYCNAQVLSRRDLDRITCYKDPFLIGTDLNAKHPDWNNSYSNSNGKVLEQYLLNSNCSIVFPPSATHFTPNKLSSTIDFFLTNTFQNCTCEVFEDLDPSDHRPVLLLPNIDTRLPTSIPVTDWEAYREFSRDFQIKSNLNSVDEIDSAIVHFQRTLNRAFYKATDFVDMPDRFVLPDQRLKDLISLRNAARRRWQRSGDPLFKEYYLQLARSVKKRVTFLKWKFSQNQIQQAKLNDHTVRHVFRRIAKRPFIIPPLKDSRDNFHSDDTAKASLVADQFSGVFDESYRAVSELQTQVADEVRDFHQREKYSPSSCDRILILFSPGSIHSLVRNLRLRKASGWDRISPELLKYASKKASIQLYYIFRCSIIHSYFPRAWKRAKVIPVLKPGKDHKLAMNYRPISLLPVMAKLFEKVIYSIMRKHITDNNILIDQQFGFRAGHSTAQPYEQLVRTDEFHTHHINADRYSAMVLLDINKAFDSVWHNGLIYKLIKLNFHPAMIKLLHSYLEDRFFFVQINNGKSTLRLIKTGLPQGSVLGPLLFLIFINDIPRRDQTSLTLFAGDAAILAACTKPDRLRKLLQDHLTILAGFFASWKIKLNSTKTQLIMFTGKRKPFRASPLILDNVEIHWMKKVKYLGVVFDSQLTWNPAVLDRRKKAIAAVGVLSILIGPRSKLPISLKILLYKVCIRPMLTYGVYLWHATHLLSLQEVQDKVLKIIFDLPPDHSTYDIHHRSNLPLLSEVLNLLLVRYNPHDHRNPLIRGTL